MAEVLTKTEAGQLACGHEVEKGEKFLLENDQEYCKQCSKSLLKDRFSEIILDLKDLGLEEVIATGLQKS